MTPWRPAVRCMPSRSKTFTACAIGSPGHRASRCTRISAEVRASRPPPADPAPSGPPPPGPPAPEAAAAEPAAEPRPEDAARAAPGARLRGVPALRPTGPPVAAFIRPLLEPHHQSGEDHHHDPDDDRPWDEGEQASRCGGRRAAPIRPGNRLVDGVEPVADAVGDPPP